MFERGAFGGATAAESFEVTTGSPPNTPESVDLGRLIVELRVAPSLPLTFLTVRLTRTGAGSLQVETR
jgi:phage tail sheath protein FI